MVIFEISMKKSFSTADSTRARENSISDTVETDRRKHGAQIIHRHLCFIVGTRHSYSRRNNQKRDNRLGKHGRLNGIGILLGNG